MVRVMFGGHEYSLTGRLADIIIWLVVRRHLLEFGAKWIEFTCRGDSVLARHGEEERIEHRRPN
jgi:hypothetical protein